MSVQDVNANTVADQTPADHLYITGGNGAQGNLPGKTFKVTFEGTLRLYNNATKKKSIKVGDTTFVLDSQQAYYLMGSSENPNLSETKNYPSEKITRLEGDFSILRLENK